MNDPEMPIYRRDRRDTARALPRLLGSLGLAGPLFFAVGVVLAGAVTPRYSHLSEPISQLAEPTRPYPLIQVTGFVMFGISMLAVGVGLWHSLSARLQGRIGIILVVVAGFNLVLTGLFRTDPMDQDIRTVSGQLHDATSGVAFVCLVVGFLVLGRAMGNVHGWDGLGSFSIAAGLAALTFLIVFAFSFEVQPQWVGVWQRLLAMTIIVWFVVIAARLRKLAHSTK